MKERKKIERRRKREREREKMFTFLLNTLIAI
jgi:hypothetical protein